MAALLPRVLCLFTLSMMLDARAASALSPDLRLLWCFDQVELPPNEPRTPHIPVGCEVVDCCPGCPGPVAIDWRIRVSGDPGVVVTLGFDERGGAAPLQPRVAGAAKWRDGTLEVGIGETLVSGLPAAMDRVRAFGRVGLAEVRSAHRASAASPAADADTGASGEPDRLGTTIVIEQLIGDVVVNESRLTYRYPCRRPPPVPPRQDVIRLPNNVANDQAVAFVDGRRAGCINDEVDRGSGDVPVGNLLSPSPCTSETTVFSDDNAMALVSPSTSWTNATGNVQSIALAALLNGPVTAWAVTGPFATTQTRISADLARASQLWNTSNCGVAFPGVINDRTTAPGAAALLDSTCAQAAQLHAQIGFTPNRLNVYYVRNAGGNRGIFCGGNTMIVATSADNESLAHEIGHALTLAHTNGVAGMANTNLMVTGGVGRNNITESQCFRANVNPGSALNVNGVRVGPTRNCPDGTTSPTCPALSLDAQPN